MATIPAVGISRWKINSNGDVYRLDGYVGIGTDSPNGLLGLGDEFTYINIDSAGNLTFTDINNGTRTLTELLAGSGDASASSKISELSEALQTILKDLDGYASITALQGLIITELEHKVQDSDAFNTIIKELDSYQSQIAGIYSTEQEHYNQQSQAIQTILQSLDGYGTGAVSASQGFDGYIAFFTGTNSIAGDNDLYWDRVSNQLKVDGYIVPNTDDYHSLGTATNRWKDLYLGPGSLHIQSTDAQTGVGKEWNIGLDGTGNLQIRQGDSNPTIKIGASGGDATYALRIQDNTTSYYVDFITSANGAYAVRSDLAASFNSYYAQAGGSYNFITRSSVYSAADGTLRFTNNSGSSGITLDFSSNNVLKLREYFNINYTTLYAGDGYFDGYLMPNQDDMFGLGTPDKRWRDLYLGPGSLHLRSTAAQTDTGIERDWAIGINNNGDFKITQGDDIALRIQPDKTINLSNSQKISWRNGANTGDFGIYLTNGDAFGFEAAISATGIVSTGNISAGLDLSAAAGQNIYWSTRSVMDSPSNGSWRLQNFLKTAGFRINSTLDKATFRKYDDSANGDLESGTVLGSISISSPLFSSTSSIPATVGNVRLGNQEYVAFRNSSNTQNWTIGTEAATDRIAVAYGVGGNGFTVNTSGVMSVSSTILTSGNMQVGSGSNFQFASSTAIFAPANGKLKITNASGSTGIVFDITTNNVLKLRNSADNDYGTFYAADGYFDGYLMPNQDDMFGLGTPDKRWRDLYLGPGSLHLRSTTSQTDTGIERDWALGIDNNGNLRFSQGDLQLLSMNAILGNLTLPNNSGFTFGTQGSITNSANGQWTFFDNSGAGIKFEVSNVNGGNLIIRQGGSASATYITASAFAINTIGSLAGINGSNPDVFLLTTSVGIGRVSLNFDTINTLKIRNTTNTEYATFYAADGYFDGYLMPNQDDMFGLGTPQKRWRDLYLGPGSVHLKSTAAQTDTGIDRDWNFGIDSSGDLTIRQDGDTKIKFGIENIILSSYIGAESFANNSYLQVVTYGGDNTVYAPTSFSSRHMLIGRQSLSGSGSGSFFFGYHNADNVGVWGALSPSVAWRPVLFNAGAPVDVGNMVLGLNVAITWSKTIATHDAPDVGIGRDSANIIKITNGVSTGGGVIKFPKFTGANPTPTNSTVLFSKDDGLGNTKFVIDPDGYVEVDGYIIPALDNTYSLGKDGFRWKELYLGPGSLHLQSTAAQIDTAVERDWNLGIDSTGNFIVKQGGDPNALKVDIDRALTIGGNLRIGSDATGSNTIALEFGIPVSSQPPALVTAANSNNIAVVRGVNRNFGNLDLASLSGFSYNNTYSSPGSVIFTLSNGGSTTANNNGLFLNSSSKVIWSNGNDATSGTFTGISWSSNNKLKFYNWNVDTIGFVLDFATANTLKIRNNTDTEYGSFVAADGYFDGYLMPNQDNMFGLGTQSLRWRDLFLGPGSIHIQSTADQNDSGIARDWILGINGAGDLSIRHQDDQKVKFSTTGDLTYYGDIVANSSTSGTQGFYLDSGKTMGFRSGGTGSMVCVGAGGNFTILGGSISFNSGAGITLFGGIVSNTSTTGITTNAATITSGGTNDYLWQYNQTLNDAGASSGNDIYRGFKFNLTETSRVGWDEVYLMDFLVNSTSKFSVTDAGKIYAADSIGIGTQNPVSKLEVRGAVTIGGTDGYIALAESAGPNFYDGYGRIWVDNTETNNLMYRDGYIGEYHTLSKQFIESYGTNVPSLVIGAGDLNIYQKIPMETSTALFYGNFLGGSGNGVIYNGQPTIFVKITARVTLESSSSANHVSIAIFHNGLFVDRSEVDRTFNSPGSPRDTLNTSVILKLEPDDLIEVFTKSDATTTLTFDHFDVIVESL